MPDLIDHLLFVVLAFLMAPRAWISFRRLRAAPPERLPRLRPRLYLVAMATQWTLVGVLVWRWLALSRPWGWLGVVPVLSPGAAGVAVGLGTILFIFILQSRSAGGREATLERARARLQHVEALLPHTAFELRLFVALAVTAGICEELLFRGFMIWYLAHWTGLIQAALLSSVLFGIGHLYQGVRGIVQTGFIGLFLAVAYLISGSLYLSIVIHALMDLYSGFVGHALVRATAADADAQEPA